jgi:ferredoxin-nitrite reductase
VPEKDVPALQQGIEELGLHWKATNIRGALVACTGNAGCKFAASNTKRHATAIADYVESRLELDRPVNIHVTGCPNSCAQHYLGDIGLLGAGVPVGDDVVEGYHVYVGGGYGESQHIGREVYRGVAATDVPVVVERMLRAYLEHRLSPEEEFSDFVRRHPTDQLKAWFDRQELSTV